MHIPDLINSLFEGLTCVFVLLDLKAIFKDKKVRGFSLWSMMFFWAWSTWNLFYYNNLSQPLSVFSTFVCECLAMWYIFLVFYYVHIEQRKKPENKKTMFWGSFISVLLYVGLGSLLISAGNAYKDKYLWTDKFNAFFEAGGGYFKMLSCLVLIKQKEFKGASVWGVAFYASWGAWNIFYYYHLLQFWSWVAGFSIFAANVWYACLIIRYRHPGEKIPFWPTE